MEKALESSNDYCIRLNVSLGDSSRFASGNIGLYFSEDSVLNNSLTQDLPHTPQVEFASTPILDDSNWTAFSTVFTTGEGERFLTIGNFNEYQNTTFNDSATPYPWNLGNGDDLGIAYYYIDDVSVVPIKPQGLPQGGDTTIIRGESVPLSSVVDTITDYSWTPSASLDDPNAAGPVASPEETTTYTVTKTTHCTTTTAEVTVHVEPPLEEQLFIPNVFAPNAQGEAENRKFRVHGGPFKAYHLQVFSRWGEMVFETKDPGEAWKGRYKGKPMKGGVYSYQFRGVLENGVEVERSGTVTLLR